MTFDTIIAAAKGRAIGRQVARSCHCDKAAITLPRQFETRAIFSDGTILTAVTMRIPPGGALARSCQDHAEQIRRLSLTLPGCRKNRQGLRRAPVTALSGCGWPAHKNPLYPSRGSKAQRVLSGASHRNSLTNAGERDAMLSFPAHRGGFFVCVLPA